jgi:hypothetical protein
MFSWFKKDPIKALEKQYLKALEEARDIRRQGDVKAAAAKEEEAEALLKQMEALEKEKKDK